MKIDSFTFMVCQIKKLDNGDIQLEQEDYVSQLDINDPPAEPGKRSLERR